MKTRRTAFWLVIPYENSITIAITTHPSCVHTHTHTYTVGCVLLCIIICVYIFRLAPSNIHCVMQLSPKNMSETAHISRKAGFFLLLKPLPGGRSEIPTPTTVTAFPFGSGRWVFIRFPFVAQSIDCPSVKLRVEENKKKLPLRYF